MDGSIFVKDMKNEWQGPFTECQIQGWYRTGWFNGSTMFYTVDSGKNSEELDEKKEFSLATLISLNGIGCPFVDFQKHDQQGFVTGKEEKLERIQKEFSKLGVQSDAAFDVEKRLKELEMRKQSSVDSHTSPSLISTLSLDDSLQEFILSMSKEETSSNASYKVPVGAPDEPKTALFARYKEEPFPTKIDIVADQAWDGYWQLAEGVTLYVLEALSLYASGECNNWNKARSESKVAMLIQLNRIQQQETIRARNAVVTYHLFEEMKHRDFFCCFFCKVVVFNYKQILIHLESLSHSANESQTVVCSHLPHVRYVMKYFISPMLWHKVDVEAEHMRQIKNGKADTAGGDVRPSTEFMGKFRAKYDHLIKNDSNYEYSISTRARLAVQNLKGPMGRQAMIELDEHIGDGKTACLSCGVNTGGREEFYAHLISSVHLDVRKIVESSNLFDLLTILVNVYRKDLV